MGMVEGLEGEHEAIAKYLLCILFKKKFYFAFHYLSYDRFRFKSGNLEHPGDVIRNASVEVLPVSALPQAHKMPGLFTISKLDLQFIYCASLICYLLCLLSA